MEDKHLLAGLDLAESSEHKSDVRFIFPFFRICYHPRLIV